MRPRWIEWASAAMAMSAVGQASAQVAPVTAAAHFEVASIRINAKAEGTSNISGAGAGRFVVTNTPLRFVILYAYGLLDHQLAAAPEWTWSTSIDITATYPSGMTPADDVVRTMVRDLLSERFGFKAHQEKREMPVYALTLARKDGRLGNQIKLSEVDCAKWIEEKRPTADAGGSSRVSPTGKRPACGMMATRRFLVGGARTTPQIAVTLQSMLGRPVLDQTGLKGAYDVDLQWASENNSETAQGDAPSIFTALQEQLGLKLIPQKAQVDVLVVDKVERPDPN